MDVDAAILRLEAAGIPVARLRRGDDLASVLGATLEEAALLRTALVSLLPAALIVTGWRQLEAPGSRELALVAAFGIAVALVPWRWPRVVVAIAAVLGVVALGFGLSPLDARPRDPDHAFFGPLFSGIWNGVLDFYEVTLPFDPGQLERMHGVVLLAVFVFTLAAALAVRARRPLLATVITFAGAAWPVTLIRDAPTTARGTLLLVAALILLAALRPGAGRGIGQTALVGAAVLLAAVIAVSSPAVAKGSFLNWQTWEPYTRPDTAVGVSYVWDANYDGIKFPKTPTTVLTIKAPTDTGHVLARHDARRLRRRPLAPGRASISTPPASTDGTRSSTTRCCRLRRATPGNWMEQKVTVRALRDTHLVGATVPVAFEPGIAGAYSQGVAYVGAAAPGPGLPGLELRAAALAPAAGPFRAGLSVGDQGLRLLPRARGRRRGDSVRASRP